MSDQALIAEGLSSIFKHREAHIVIALTGRTGSGCTSVARLLATSDFSAIELPETSRPPESQESRKSQIINEWLKHNWSAFLKINLSEVILLLVLTEECNDIVKQVQNAIPDTDAGELRSLFGSTSAKATATVSTLTNLRTASDDEIAEAHGFLFKDLPDIAQSMRLLLSRKGRSHYTATFQTFGNNIRRSGKASSDQVSPSSLLILPEIISQILKLHRIQCRKRSVDKVYVV